MPKGSIDLLGLLILFIGLQAWWIYPIIKKNKRINKKKKNLKESIQTLERLYKR